jgi:hypothetical protein
VLDRRRRWLLRRWVERLREEGRIGEVGRRSVPRWFALGRVVGSSRSGSCLGVEGRSEVGLVNVSRWVGEDW